ncbi:MAG: hypothetical protein LBQ48_00510 [Oscillospiraceae bacterium]|nr:hypothetical protein [Oscillospiraceae bacterium]
MNKKHSDYLLLRRLNVGMSQRDRLAACAKQNAGELEGSARLCGKARRQNSRQIVQCLVVGAIITLSILMFLSTSCSAGNVSDDATEIPVALITLPEPSTIMCVADNDVYYYTEEFVEEEYNPNIVLFSKNIYINDTKKIGEIKDAAGYPIESLFINGNVYFLLKRNSSENVIYEINANDGSVEPIYKIEDDLSFAFLKGMKNAIVVLKIIKGKNGFIRYEIDNLDLRTYKSKKIVEKSAKENSGTVISHIYATSESFYTLEGDRNGDDTMNIVNYNQNGGVIEEYKVDLSEFLDIRDIAPESQHDFALDLYVTGNYFIISTANQRKIIYELERNELKEIKIPGILYENVPTSYQVLIPSGGEISACLYFYNRGNGDLIKFDGKKGGFASMILPRNHSGGAYMYLNNKNQLFMRQTNNLFTES